MDDLGKVLAAYKRAAIAHGEATVRGNYRAGNKQHDELIKAHLALRTAGTEGLWQLRTLLSDENANVACWAATHLLPYFETQAIETLSRIALQTDLLGLNAAMTLKEWQKGCLKLD